VGDKISALPSPRSES